MTTRKTTAGKKPINRKNAVIKAKPKTGKFAPKSVEEKTELQCLISIAMRKSTPAPDIIKDLQGRGFKISVTTFYQYIKDIRAEWQTAMSQNYEAHVASQFAKLDLLEERLWKMLDKSMTAEEKTTLTNEGGKVSSEKKETKNRHGEVEIALAIERIWVRRNELLGITSSTINIQNNIQNNIENKIEATKVEFQPVSDKFHGNFVIEVDNRGLE